MLKSQSKYIFFSLLLFLSPRILDYSNVNKIDIPKKFRAWSPERKKVYLLCILWEIDMSGVARWFLEIRLENM